MSTRIWDNKMSPLSTLPPIRLCYSVSKWYFWWQKRGGDNCKSQISSTSSAKPCNLLRAPPHSKYLPSSRWKRVQNSFLPKSGTTAAEDMRGAVTPSLNGRYRPSIYRRAFQLRSRCYPAKFRDVDVHIATPTTWKVVMPHHKLNLADAWYPASFQRSYMLF